MCMILWWNSLSTIRTKSDTESRKLQNFYSLFNLHIIKLVATKGSNGCFGGEQWTLPNLHFNDDCTAACTIYNHAALSCCLKERKEHQLPVLCLLQIRKISQINIQKGNHLLLRFFFIVFDFFMQYTKMNIQFSDIPDLNYINRSQTSQHGVTWHWYCFGSSWVSLCTISRQ